MSRHRTHVAIVVAFLTLQVGEAQVTEIDTWYPDLSDEYGTSTLLPAPLDSYYPLVDRELESAIWPVHQEFHEWAWYRAVLSRPVMPVVPSWYFGPDLNILPTSPARACWMCAIPANGMHDLLLNPADLCCVLGDGSMRVIPLQ